MRTPEINGKRQINIEKRNCEETQSDFPEICHSSNSVNKEVILLKGLRVEDDLLALMNHSDMMRKIESLINGASNGYLYQSCKNMKENLSFLQKELSAKDEFIKSLLETQAAILNSLSNSTEIFKIKKKIWKIKR